MARRYRCPRQWENSMSMSSFVAFLKDESGATAIEYGLMAAGISVVILATLNTVGSKLNSKCDKSSGLLRKENFPEAPCREPPLWRLLFSASWCPRAHPARRLPNAG